MKRLLLFLAFSLIAEFCAAVGYLVSPFVCFPFDWGKEEFGDIDDAMGFGLGISVPLLFNEKLVEEAQGNGGFFDVSTYSYFTITPTVAVDYACVFTNILRVRAGVSFGKVTVDIISFGFHVGVLGTFMKDFTNDIDAYGISPTISVGVAPFLQDCRVQVQYDFYTVERYNRFIITFAFAPTVWADGF